MAEGVLIDLSEDVPGISDSMECERTEVISMVSPLRPGDRILLTESAVCSPRKPDSSPNSPGNIEDEIFDFDLPVTPSTASEKSADDVKENIEDEEEVFFGPVGFTERCVSTAVNAVRKETKPLSPLTPHSLARICEEANAIASLISSSCTPKKKSCSVSIFKKEAVHQLLKAANKSHKETEEDRKTGSPVQDKASIGEEKCETVKHENLTVAAHEQKTDIEKTHETDQKQNIQCHENTDNAQEGKQSKMDNKQDDQKKNGPSSSSIPSLQTELCMEGVEPLNYSSSESEDTPNKKHRRSGTFTLDKPVEELLPENKQTSSPVVNNTDKSAVTDHTESKPSAEKNKRSASKLQHPASKLAKVKSGIRGLPALKKITKCPSPEEPKETKPVSRLSLPKSRLPVDDSNIGRSRLKPPGLSRSNSTTTRPQQIPQRSGLQQPTVKAFQPTVKAPLQPVVKAPSQPTVKAPPMMKLMKPGTLQRSTIASNHSKLSEAARKGPTGPMKAVIPSNQMSGRKEKVSAVSNVEKMDTDQESSGGCTTPKKSGSSSSVEGTGTPASSVKCRRSFLPTPNKSRLSSAGSCSSPGSFRRGSSVSSCESPLITNLKARQRRVSSSSSVGKYTRLDHIDDSSPSALKPKKMLVTNTPNVPKKKTSAWSPVRKKKPVDPFDQAIMCTKKIKN